jgi:hypothetical protein
LELLGIKAKTVLSYQIMRDLNYKEIGHYTFYFNPFLYTILVVKGFNPFLYTILVVRFGNYESRNRNSNQRLFVG